MLINITDYAKLKKTNRVNVYRQIKAGKIQTQWYKKRQLIEIDKPKTLEVE